MTVYIGAEDVMYYIAFAACAIVVVVWLAQVEIIASFNGKIVITCLADCHQHVYKHLYPINCAETTN
jgi:uncharacterized membrane protein YjjB (DUF3815 family)